MIVHVLSRAPSMLNTTKSIGFWMPYWSKART